VRYYMTQKIIAKGLHNADEACTAYTINLMEQLEQTKAEYPIEDAIQDEVAAQAYCEQFALQIFAKGDNQIRGNQVTKATTDTLQAASTFLELLSIWKNPPEPEIKSKMTFAKFHALRILKAIQAGEDPNLSNPKQETPPDPSALDPDDPEVQLINEAASRPGTQNPYQSYAESAPNTSARPSPSFSAQRAPSPPTHLSASAQYSHADVSPISQPNSRQASVGGGYFPRVDVPTFTADNAAPGLPTAPSMDDQIMTDPPQIPQPPQAPDPTSFYQNQTSSPPIQQLPPVQQQQTPQPPPMQNPFVSQQGGFSSPPPPNFQPGSTPLQQYNANPLQPAQRPLNTDEESVHEAQKHAKWAISALNFEDVSTAVKELRIALQALGAS
jgi:vacuolar protein sorting-associated protein VTA1